MQNIFSDITIVDATRVFAGPHATQYFTQYGATVIKIEHPSGDESRQFAPLRDGASGYFEILNRGKQSVVVDLKTDEGKTLFSALLAQADIFVENYTPVVRSRLWIEPKALLTKNPSLIYASLNGYGDQSNTKAYDAIIQAESGIASLNGSSEPMKNATAIVDAYAGKTLALAISSLLYQREKTGKGWYVNVPMLSCGLQMLEQNLIESSISHKDPPLAWNHDTAIFPFGFFKTQDWSISLAIGNNRLREIFRTHYLSHSIDLYPCNQDRLDHRETLIVLIQEAFSHYTTSDISNQLSQLWIPNAPIQSMQDILNTPHYYSQWYLQTIDHSKLWTCTIPTSAIRFWDYTAEPLSHAPSLWEHTKLFMNKTTKKENMKIIPYHQKHYNSFVTLVAICFDVEHWKSESLVQWKFFDTPESKTTITQCAVADNQVVGQYSLIGIQLQQAWKIRESFRSQDMCILPQHRKQWLITKIATEAYKRVTTPSLIIGFSNAQWVRVDRWSKKYGYTVVDQFTRISLFPTFSRSIYTSQEHTTSQEIEHLPFESFNYFDQYILIKKDYSYITRRYFDKPSSDYHFFTFSQWEEVHWWATLKFHKWVCSILDLHMKKNTGIEEILTAIQNLAYKSWSPIVTLMTIENSLSRQLFKNHRTLKKKQPYYLTIKKHLQQDEANVLDQNQWWVVGGDVL